MPSFPSTFPSFGASPAPRTITPGDSDSEDIIKNFYPEPVWSEGSTLTEEQPSHPPMVAEVVDSDMDMMDTSEPASFLPQSDPTLLEPGPSQPDPVAPSITGRMPTPIHCSFAAQLRGNNWSGAAGNVMASSPIVETHSASSGEALGPDSDLAAYQGRLGHESVPRSLDGPAATVAVMENWSMVQNRRLPSPISESGGEEGLGSPGMMLDSSSQMRLPIHPDHQHSLLSSPQIPAAADVSQAGDSPESTGSPSPEGTMDVESPSTPSPRKGHTRSRHTVNSWTALQPGMKRSFSIGYRADCEKCRMKVPGHFNHIIVS